MHIHVTVGVHLRSQDRHCTLRIRTHQQAPHAPLRRRPKGSRCRRHRHPRRYPRRRCVPPLLPSLTSYSSRRPAYTCTNSELPPAHRALARHHQARAQEVVYDQRRQDQPRKAGELPRGRGVRPRRVPREQPPRRQGVPPPYRHPVRARGRAPAGADVDGPVCPGLRAAPEGAKAGLGEGTSVSVPCPCPLSHNFVT